jgi:hypothetical protein
VEEINELKREGLSIQAISQLTGFDRKTIRKYLLKPTGRPVYSSRPAPVSKLEPFEAYLKERLQAGVWNAQVLLRELRERNYQGGYQSFIRRVEQDVAIDPDSELIADGHLDRWLHIEVSPRDHRSRLTHLTADCGSGCIRGARIFNSVNTPLLTAASGL